MHVKTNRPIPGSYGVEPGRLLAGGCPGSPSAEIARRNVRSLLQSGVSVFLDLTAEHEPYRYVCILEEEAARLGYSVEHRRMSTSDHRTPTQEQMAHVLDALDAALESGGTVFAHCYAGIGRTGTVVGCYLVRHGMSGEQALHRIARLRYGTPDGVLPSPETEQQVQMVLSWKEKATSYGCSERES